MSHIHASPAISYQDLPYRRLLVVGLLAIFAPVLALLLGVVDVPASDVFAVLGGYGSPQAHSIIWDIRLPRIVTGMLVGIHFAVAGLVLQNITRNPLADPSIMGVSQGATLAVSLFLLFSTYIHYIGTSVRVKIPLEWLPTVATIGGLAAGLIIYLLTLRRNLGPLRLTLCGIAIGAVLHAVAIGIIAGWGTSQMESLIEWLAGSLYARSWEHALYLLPFTLVGLGLLPLIRRPLQLLRFDSAIARSFGLSYKRQFSIALSIACILAASAAGTVGPVIFVGLVVPHLARILAGKEQILVLPITIALGSITVTLGDMIGRLLGGVEEIPVGVITALFGVPVMIALLRKTR